MAAKSPKQEFQRLQQVREVFTNNVQEDLQFINEQQAQAQEEGPDADSMQGQLIRLTRVVTTLNELLWDYDELLQSIVNGKLNRDPVDTIENRFKEFPY